MGSTANGLACVLVGCLLILLNGHLARGYAEFRRRLLGFAPARHGTGRERTLVVFVGAALVLVGVLLLASLSPGFPLLGRS